MRWVEAVSDKVADTTGLGMPFARRVLYILVPLGQGSNELGVTSRQGFVDGGFRQELTIHDYEGVDVGKADVALCRLLLNGYVAYRWRPDRVVGDPGGELNETNASANELHEVPAWLALGVAQTFYPAYKSQNASILLEQWERGLAPTLKQFLAPVEEDSLENVHDKAVCGMFVGWLSSLPDAPEVFDSLFCRIAEGLPPSREWMIETLKDCETAIGLEKLWDKWILRQKRLVYMPGVVTPRILRQFKDELVVYRENSDVSDGSDLLFRCTLEELIPRRKEPWIPASARNKITRIRILFMGRGSEMNAVIESYSLFLQALAEGKREARLRSLFAKAQETLRTLEETTEREAVPLQGKGSGAAFGSGVLAAEP